MARHIDLEGVENFRDFGGYATRCGRGVRDGLLFRSANHARATEADLAALEALGIHTVVDLRRANERARDPSRRWSSFAGQVIENDIDDASMDWGEFLRHAVPSPEWFFEDCVGFYRRAPLEPRHLDLFTRYFRALADAEGSILVHCAAGKDRTGLICAFTHHVAGVHEDDLIADYMATNDEARIARRAEAFARWAADHYGAVVPDEAARIAQSVHPAYLEAALATIDEAYGSLDAYVEKALGVTPAMRDRIHDKLLG